MMSTSDLALFGGPRAVATQRRQAPPRDIERILSETRRWLEGSGSALSGQGAGIGQGRVDGEGAIEEVDGESS